MLIRPKLILAPTSEPISVNDLKEHLRVGNQDDLAYLQDLIGCAREYCEERLAQAFYTQTLEITLDYWPCGDRIILPRCTPLQSVTSVIYVDAYGAQTVWSTADYIIDYHFGQIVLPYGKVWPLLTTYPVNAVIVRYIVGTDPDSPLIPIPARIRQAMRMLAAHWYENREAATIGTLMQSNETVIGVKSLLTLSEEPSSF